MSVSLPKDEQTYGFYLVVKNRAGLGKAPPQSGDLPQVRLERDLTLPEAFLFKPEADPARRDCLVLRWEAKDRNFGSNPVTLEWAARRRGPGT